MRVSKQMQSADNVGRQEQQISNTKPVAGESLIHRNKPKPNRDDSLVEFVELLEAVDEFQSGARLNEVSMIGKDGRRVFF